MVNKFQNIEWEVLAILLYVPQDYHKFVLVGFLVVSIAEKECLVKRRTFLETSL